MSKRFQYSNKMGDKIIVVESTDETWEDFMLDVEQADVEFGKGQSVKFKVPEEELSPKPALVCQVCGGKAEIKEGVSKAGNEYKIFRCLSNPEIAPEGHSKFVR